MTEEHIERFIRKPELFTFQQYKIEGLNASLVEAYSHALFDGKNKSNRIISLAKPLVSFIDSLPEFSRSTRSSLLSSNTIKAREAIKMSKSPEKLIFEDLPLALGYKVLEKNSEVDSEEFSSRLHRVIIELKSVYPKLLEKQAKMISAELHDGATFELDGLRTHVRKQYGVLDGLAIGATRSFVKSLIDQKGSDEQWLENVLVCLSRKRPAKWKDQDLAKSEATLADLSRSLRELVAISYETNREINALHDSDFEVIMLRAIKPSAAPKEKVVTINKREKERVNLEVNKHMKLLNSVPENVKMAVLAQLVEIELPEKADHE